jgi:multicomponent Na+:H+ antiporter subunit G
MVIEVLSKIFILTGAFFMFVAALGVYRMHDLYMRLHASTKSATFGVGFLLLGAALQFWDSGISARALAIVLFTYATAPVAAHMIGRAAYFVRVPLWEGTLSDDLLGKYDETTHELTAQREETRIKSKKSSNQG